MARFQFTLTQSDAVYIAQHLRVMDRIEADATSYHSITDLDRGRDLAESSRNHLAYTVWAANDEPVAMGGWIALWPGVASAWMLATDRIGDVGVALDHAILSGHRRMFEMGFHRLQAFGLSKRTDTRHWLIALGYIPEGVHHSWGRNGETFVSYAKLKKDDA